MIFRATRRSFNVVILIAVIALGGCASLGPAADSSGVAALTNAVDHAEGTVRQHFHAFWFPNEAGYTDMNKATIGSGGKEFTEGFLVLADKSLIFLVWDRLIKEYSVLIRIPYDRLSSVRLTRFGRSRRVTVRELDTLRPNTFEIVSGLLVDQKASAQVAAFINAKIQSNNTHDSRGKP
ncbi:hypothetical protein [uncultured Lamprocystis sp.]|jgi:hypothetical protein|uniref:hypothetical protein n=1 Tax=uncultured Lamprocystis sp. TaxID=543132 RepID=UPI002600ED16|nr:hypothetical protein [uncultured Lamprocystis sp.]